MCPPAPSPGAACSAPGAGAGPGGAGACPDGRPGRRGAAAAGARGAAALAARQRDGRAGGRGHHCLRHPQPGDHGPGRLAGLRPDPGALGRLQQRSEQGRADRPHRPIPVRDPGEASRGRSRRGAGGDPGAARGRDQGRGRPRCRPRDVGQPAAADPQGAGRGRGCRPHRRPPAEALCHRQRHAGGSRHRAGEFRSGWWRSSTPPRRRRWHSVPASTARRRRCRRRKPTSPWPRRRSGRSRRCWTMPRSTWTHTYHPRAGRRHGHPAQRRCRPDRRGQPAGAAALHHRPGPAARCRSMPRWTRPMSAGCGWARRSSSASTPIPAGSSAARSSRCARRRRSVQNVVTYDAVLSAPNPDQALLPGLTANGPHPHRAARQSAAGAERGAALAAPGQRARRRRQRAAGTAFVPGRGRRAAARRAAHRHRRRRR